MGGRIPSHIATDGEDIPSYSARVEEGGRLKKPLGMLVGCVWVI